MEFLDSKAVESEGEEEDADQEGIQRRDDSKTVPSDEDDEEEDDDNEIDDERVVHDLIDDNPIESDNSDGEAGGAEKRKQSDDEDELPDMLDDDDYDLIVENTGVNVQRKRFKRLRRIVDDDSDEEGGREAIANQLFEGSDNEEERPGSIRGDTLRHYDSEESEHSDEDDFIVDDDGRAIRESRIRRPAIFSNANFQEAQEVFGVDFDYERLEEEDEEGGTVRRGKTVMEMYEPYELELAGRTEKDTKIRSTDIPERMQLRCVPITEAKEEELLEEADWIYEVEFKNRSEKKEPFKKPPLTIVPGGTTTAVESEANWDDDWDKQTTVSTRPQTNVGEVEVRTDWTQPPASVVEPFPRPAATQVGEGNWDQDEWEAPAPKDKVDSATATPVEPVPQDRKTTLIPKIRIVLQFFRNHHFEVPFILNYRQECIEPDLPVSDLWKIYRLDARFCQLRSRKNRLLELFKNMQQHVINLHTANPDEPIRLISNEDLECVKSVNSVSQLEDMHQLFGLYYADKVPSMKEYLFQKRNEEMQRALNAGAAEGSDQALPQNDPDEKSTMRRKIGVGPYEMCKKLGIDSFIKMFGLTSDKLAENMRNDYQQHVVEQCQVDPKEAASEMCSQRVKTPEEVLKAAKLMIATQISREPFIRQCVRKVFFDRATISCCPTKKGQKEIDETHRCYAMKYLKDKPVGELVEDQFLKLSLAEKDGLITISIGEKIKGITDESTCYIDDIKHLFVIDEYSKIAEDWNEFRYDCIEHAFEKLLYPELRKELRAKLYEDAKEHVVTACSNKLFHYLKVAPYKVHYPGADDGVWGTSEGLRILAIAFDLDYELACPSYACIISSGGELLVDFKLKNILKNSKSHKETDELDKEEDLLAIKTAILMHKPHLIVIGGESRDALSIQTDVQRVVNRLVMEEDDFPKVEVLVVDNEMAKVYASSNKSARDFREAPLLVKQAISLGRRMQDPLIEFAQLYNADEEILCLRFHPLQDHVSKEELLERLECEFINRTNEVGVDVNRIAVRPHTSVVLQFVCGLGPRKAAGVVQVLKNNQRLENRSQLVTTFGLGQKTFINCSGFIKIDTDSLLDSTESYIDVLDGSRVHPETYEWAKRMAVDALDLDVHDTNHAIALEEVLDCPDKLKDLDLDAFADELDRTGYGDKKTTLYKIRTELYNRYQDLRIRYEEPNPEEMFNMLTKETPESLYIGKLITATVTGIAFKKPNEEELASKDAEPRQDPFTKLWQCPFCSQNGFTDVKKIWDHLDHGACQGQAIGVCIRLYNGISGFIHNAKLSDSNVTNPAERVKRGQTVNCRVIRINVERFSVECTSRTSDLLDVPGEWKPKKDEFYDQEKEDFEVQQEEEVFQKKQIKISRSSAIRHPSFKNVDFRGAEKMMETMDQGEAIIRPSSKGANHLTLTWKVTDGIYQHVDIQKQGKATTKSARQSFLISGDEFEDLDEIIARYVSPMASHARDLISYKYCVKTLGGVPQQANDYLLAQRTKNPDKLHYLLQASTAYPGKFLLSYLPRINPVHEFITVTPDGFRFRQQNFDNLNQLLVWFKHHYRDPPPARMLMSSTPSSHASGLTCGYDIDGQGSRVNTAIAHRAIPAQANTYAASTVASSPYTPNSHTPFSTLTPFTPNHPSPNRFGLTPNIRPVNSSGFLHPGISQPRYRMDERKAVEEYARSFQQQAVNRAWPSQGYSVVGSCGSPGPNFRKPSNFAQQRSHAGNQTSKKFGDVENWNDPTPSAATAKPVPPPPPVLQRKEKNWREEEDWD